MLRRCEICKFQKNIRFLSKVEMARILGINPNSTKKEANEKARIYHPDKIYYPEKKIRKFSEKNLKFSEKINYKYK